MPDEIVPAEFIADLDKEARQYERRSQVLTALQWAVTLAVTSAGAVTAWAGAPEVTNTGQASAWFKSPTTLLICGLVVAVGTSLNQLGLAGKVERNQQLAMVVKGIADAVRAGIMPLDRATGLRIRARANPHPVIEELCKPS